MKTLKISSDPRIKEVFAKYPEHARFKLEQLRTLIFEVASGLEDIESIEETLKWGEPSYLAKHGSTIRIDWKPKNPDQFAIYFKCTSKLVPTFKALYPKIFKFEGNRAIVFPLNEEIPKGELKHCISMALNYHKIKHLPILGA